MTANISSPCQGTGEQKLTSLRQILLCAPLSLLSLPLMASLGSRSEEGFFLVGPDLVVEGGLDCLANSWEVGINGVATPRVLPCPLSNAVAPP